MAAEVIEVEGTLDEDGNIRLDTKPALPAGRVRLKVEAVPDYTQTSLWRFFQQIEADREAGNLPRTPQHILDEYIATMRDDPEAPEGR